MFGVEDADEEEDDEEETGLVQLSEFGIHFYAFPKVDQRMLRLPAGAGLS